MLVPACSSLVDIVYVRNRNRGYGSPVQALGFPIKETSIIQRYCRTKIPSSLRSAYFPPLLRLHFQSPSITRLPPHASPIALCISSHLCSPLPMVYVIVLPGGGVRTSPSRHTYLLTTLSVDVA